MLQINSPKTTEGSTLTFLFSLTAPAAGGEVVWYSTRYATGTATGGIDFVEVEGFITWNAGQTEAIITVQTLTDSAIEGDEWLILEYDTADFDVEAFWAYGTITDAQTNKPTLTLGNIKPRWNLNGIAQLTALASDADGTADLRGVQWWIGDALGVWTELGWSNMTAATATSSNAELWINAPAPGIYRLAAFAYDQNWNHSLVQVVQVEVTNQLNTIPAFTALTASYDNGQLTISGTVTDADGINDIDGLVIWKQSSTGIWTELGYVPVPATGIFNAIFQVAGVVAGDLFHAYAWDEGGTGTRSASPTIAPPPNQPPTVTQVLNKTTYAPTETVALTLTITDPDTATVSRTTVVKRGTTIVDTINGTNSATLNLSLLGRIQGAYTVETTATDGSLIATDTDSFTVTNAVPTLTINTTANGSIQTISGTVGDANGNEQFGGSIWLAPPGGAAWQEIYTIPIFTGVSGNYSYNLSTAGYAQGLYGIYAYAWDSEEVVERSTSFTIGPPPNIAPTLTFNLSKATYDPTESVAWSGIVGDGDDPTVALTIQRLTPAAILSTNNAQALGNYSGSSSLLNLAPGTYTLRATAQDEATSVQVDRTLTVTNAAPTVAISGVTVTGSTVTFTATATDANGGNDINAIELRRAGNLLTTTPGSGTYYALGTPTITGSTRTQTVTVYNMPIGANQALEYRAISGTLNGNGTATVTIANQAPSLTVSLNKTSFAPTESVTATITITDPDTATVNRTSQLKSGTTVLQTLTGSNSGSAVFPLINLVAGTYTIETSANDGVTNVTDSKTLTITNAAPTVAITNPTVNVKTFTFTATATDGNGGGDISSIEVKVGSTVLTTTPGSGTYYTAGTPTIAGSTRTQTITISNMPIGSNTVTYTAFSGGLSGLATSTAVIANIAPTLTQVLSKASYAPTESVSATLTITDPDTATVNRTTQLRSGTTVLATTNGTNSGIVPFSLSGMVAGTYNIYSTANDGTSTVTDTDNFTVLNVSPTGTVNLTNNGNGNYTVSGTIADNNSLIQHGGQVWLEPTTGQNGGNWINVGNVVPVSNTGISSTYSNSFSTAGYAAGTWKVHVYAWDVDPAVELSGNPTFTIVAANLPPTITTNGNQTHTPSLAASSVITTATFSDPEGQTITSSAELRNSQGTAVRTFGNQTGNSRSFSWQTWGLEGAYTSRVSASDGTNTTIKNDTITILNATPTIKAFGTGTPNSLYVAVTGSNTTIAATITDLNGIGDIQNRTLQYRQGGGAWNNIQQTFTVTSDTDGNLSGTLDAYYILGTTEFRATASDEAATATATTTFTIGKPIIYQGSQITDSTPDFIGYKMVGVRSIDGSNNSQMAWREQSTGNIYTASVNTGSGQWEIGSWAATTAAASESVFLQDLNLDGRISGTVASGKDNVENAGSIGLSYNNGYALRDGGNVITIKANGVQVTDSLVPGYKLVGIERTASPTTAHTYDAIWRSDALNAWASWKIGSNGERVLGSWTDLTIAQVQAYETAFRQDLSGDFRIGSNINSAWIDTIDSGAAYSNGYVMI